MGNTRKITVITPFYNVSNHIDRYFTKLSQQTFFNQIEVIWIDDCSNDGTYDRLLTYSKIYNNITLIRNETNRGSGYSRNRGLDLATGEYISFLDSDDWYFANDSLERFYKDAIGNNAIICGSAITSINAQGTINTFFTKDSEFKFNNRFVNFDDFQYIFYFTRYLYKRQFLNENNLRFKDYKRFQDPVFLYDVMVKSGGFYGVPYSTYCFTINNHWKTLNIAQHYDRISAMSELFHDLSSKHEKIRNFLIFNIIKFFDYDVNLMSLILENRKLLLKYQKVLLDDDFKNEVIKKLDEKMVKRYREITSKITSRCDKNTPQKISSKRKTNKGFRRFQFG